MKMSRRQWLYGSECHQFLNETEIVLLVYLSWIRHSSGSTQIGCCDAFFYDNCQWTDLLLLHRSHDAGRGLMLPLFPKRQSASYACAVAALSLFCLWIIFMNIPSFAREAFFFYAGAVWIFFVWYELLWRFAICLFSAAQWQWNHFLVI